MFQRLRACCRGAVSIEAAIVLPVLLTLLLGILEFGLMFFTYNAVQNAGREVARQLSINFITEGQIPAAVRARVPGWAQGDLEVAVSQSTPLDPMTNVISIALTLPATSAAPLPLFARMGSDWTLATTINMKQELPL